MKKLSELPIVVRDDCPRDSVYFLPSGSHTFDPSNGKTLELAPGFYVNPKSLGAIKNIK